MKFKEYSCNDPQSTHKTEMEITYVSILLISTLEWKGETSINVLSHNRPPTLSHYLYHLLDLWNARSLRLAFGLSYGSLVGVILFIKLCCCLLSVNAISDQTNRAAYHVPGSGISIPSW